MYGVVMTLGRAICCPNESGENVYIGTAITGVEYFLPRYVLVCYNQ